MRYVLARERVKLILVAGIPPSPQIVEQVERLVAFGVYRPGDPLPGAGTLALELGISRVTVQKAFGALCERGIAEAVVGTGTFIARGADTRADLIGRMLSSTIALAQNLYLTKIEVEKAFEHQLRRHFPERKITKKAAHLKRPTKPVQRGSGRRSR